MIFHESDPAIPYLRSNDTVIGPFLKRHIIKDHPERIPWIEAHPKEIALTVRDPDIIEAKTWQRKNGHWSQTFVKEIPEENGFSVVALSLANLPGEVESDFHQVTTIYFVKKRSEFFSPAGEIKPRWLKIK